MTKYTVHVLWLFIRVRDRASTFIYLFSINTKTITFHMYHIIIADSVKTIVTIKIDDGLFMFCRRVFHRTGALVKLPCIFVSITSFNRTLYNTCKRLGKKTRSAQSLRYDSGHKLSMTAHLSLYFKSG